LIKIGEKQANQLRPILEKVLNSVRASSSHKLACGMAGAHTRSNLQGRTASQKTAFFLDRSRRRIPV